MNTDQQIEKLETVERLASDASKSRDADRRLGAFLLYAGIVDFIAIQAARLIEQIILKSQLAEDKTPSFQPSPETFFYDRRISTRTILKSIRKMLPFISPDSDEAERAKRVTDLAHRMIELGFEFLNFQDPIVHHISDPRKRFEDIILLCDQANEAYQRLREAHTAFFEAAAPYRFSERELQYFYGKWQSN